MASRKTRAGSHRNNLGSTATRNHKTGFLILGPLNYNLLFAIVFLNIFGIIMIYSSSYYSAVNLNYKSYHFLLNQVIFVLIGMAAMWAVSRINYHIWISLGWFGLLFSVLLVLALKTSLGVSAKGAVRWLRIGAIQFQAAEPIKLFMMVYFSMLISRYGIDNRFWRLVAWGSMLIMTVLLGLISDNLSTAIIIFGICYAIFFISEKRVWPYVVAVIVAFFVLLIFLASVEYLIPYNSKEDFRITRIRAFFHPNDYIATFSTQPMQALYALGSGGFWGKGLGQSLVKFRLAEPYNDYILAIICEELGGFGACILLFLFGYLLWQIVKIERAAWDVEGKIFCAGVFVQVALQAVLNIMVVVNWFPTTGVSLPFISYGGASAIFLLVEFGVIFSIDNYSKNLRFRREAEREARAKEKQRREEE